VRRRGRGVNLHPPEKKNLRDSEGSAAKEPPNGWLQL